MHLYILCYTVITLRHSQGVYNHGIAENIIMGAYPLSTSVIYSYSFKTVVHIPEGGKEL